LVSADVHSSYDLKLRTFLHGVDEKFQPAAKEHPTHGALPVAWTGAALAGAIDEIAIAKPATKSNEAFKAMSSQKLGQEMPNPERKITRLRYAVESALGHSRTGRADGTSRHVRSAP